jgi:exonuclease SbcD
LATRPEELFHPIELTTASGKICFWTLPFCEPAQIRELLGQEEIHSMDEAFRAMIEKVEPKEEAVNVLVTHCFAAGGQIGASESPAFVGGSAQVGTDLFEKFDYTALGHLHGPQKAGKGRYSGSPLTYSFDEANQKKSVTMVEWKNSGQEVTEIPVCPPNRVRVISGNFEELLQEAKENPSEDYLFAELCDTKPIYLPLDQLRPYYPNLLGLSSQWLLSKGEGDNQKLREQIHHRADDLTIFEEFMEQICGIEAEEEDKKLVQKMLHIDLEEEEEKAE